ncbi:MAG: phosphatase PAP2 family protein [Phycisphaerales bacterium]|nr:phosphatase PAP2 family protein [Phycisphaerales bacterium]
MIYLSTYEQSQINRRHLIELFGVVGVLAGLTIIDFWLLGVLYHPQQGTEHQWQQFFRVMGFLGTWAIVGGAFASTDRTFKRAGSVMLAPLVAGSVAEFLKLIIGRARPIENGQLLEGWYHFRPLLDGFRDGHNLGMPSSHAAVAFAGAITVAYHLPRTRLIMIGLAIGCGYTRISSNAHFPTDVFLGGVIGWLAARLFRELTVRIHASDAVSSTAHDHP